MEGGERSRRLREEVSQRRTTLLLYRSKLIILHPPFMRPEAADEVDKLIPAEEDDR
jgi:hypothetical protein